jgi:hypothetical protein
MAVRLAAVAELIAVRAAHHHLLVIPLQGVAVAVLRALAVIRAVQVVVVVT